MAFAFSISADGLSNDIEDLCAAKSLDTFRPFLLSSLATVVVDHSLIHLSIQQILGRGWLGLRDIVYSSYTFIEL